MNGYVSWKYGGKTPLERLLEENIFDGRYKLRSTNPNITMDVVNKYYENSWNHTELSRQALVEKILGKHGKLYRDLQDVILDYIGYE